jgi:subtilase family serine protease
MHALISITAKLWERFFVGWIQFQRRSLPIKPSGLGWLAIAMLALAPIAVLRAASLQVVHDHGPAPIALLHPLGRLASSNQLELTIGLNLQNRAALTNLLSEIYDPSSPNYHQYLSPEQFAARFGPTEQDYETVIAFANVNRLRVTRKHANRTMLDVTGSVAEVEKAFHVNMFIHQHPSEARTFFAPDAEPSLDLAVPVLSIAGLDNYRLPQPANLKARPKDGSPANPIPDAGTGPGGTYQGYDFRAAYLPGVTLTGSGQALGLLEFDGYYSNDIAIYENRAGLPNVMVTNVLLNGFLGIPGANNFEVALDIELAIAMAPSLSELIVYEAGPQGAADSALNRMATDNLCKQLGSSWLWGAVDDPSADQVFQQFAAQGQSFFNAAGDVDAYTNAIPFPADNPYITTVGATTLTTTAGGFWSSETVWNSGGGVGSSGGISPFYLIPTWQQGINMTTNGGSTTCRNLPDVAMVGNNISVIWNNGQTNTFAGTSCSTPLWAAFMALVNQQGAVYGQPPAGFINPAIYALGRNTNYSSCFHDSTNGNNTKGTSPTRFLATPGYDLCTGWGTPAGQALIDALAPPSYLIISPVAGLMASGPPGGPFTPPTQSLSISNHGSVSLSWSVTNLAVWLTLTPANGTLPVGGNAASITVGFNSAAYTLTSGVYHAAVLFTDKNIGQTQTRSFALQISPSLVQNGGFETGNFTNWSLAGDTNINSVSASRFTPHSGQYAAAFGQYGSLAYLSQTVPTVPGQAYLLSFWVANPMSGTPNQLLVDWIQNPANTNTLLSLTNLDAFTWTNEQFIVTSTGASAVLQFGFRDDPQYLGLDDVSLIPVPTPVLATTTPASGTLAFSWAAYSGLKYQVQFKTNLTQAGWINLGAPITASNATGVATVSFGTDLQRFFRVMGLP